MNLRSIRQTADTAAIALDKLGDRVHPAVTRAIAAHFELEKKQTGELGVEFLQGFYSGAFFVHSWLLKTAGPTAAPTQMVAQLTIEAARQYIGHIEKLVEKG